MQYRGLMYRPFKNAAEYAQCAKSPVFLIQPQATSFNFEVQHAEDGGITTFMNYTWMLANCTFENGTPFGIVEGKFRAATAADVGMPCRARGSSTGAWRENLKLVHVRKLSGNNGQFVVVDTDTEDELCQGYHYCEVLE